MAGEDLRLVVGLGNPGRQYEGTRHNIGFAVLDRIAAARGATFCREAKWKGDCLSADGIMFLKPATYMNLSGEAVGAVVRYHQLAASQVLVVLDDVSLPTGQLRLRARGSAGGHNGLRSIITHLGTQEVPRLRIGIGDAGGEGRMTGHVLGHFREDERELVRAGVDRAVEAVSNLLKNGLAVAMNLYNKHQHP